MGYDGSIKFDTSILTDGFNAGVTQLGNIAKSGLAVLSTAVLSGVTAFGVLTKSALDSVASMEQNIGGVETLFKKSADTVIKNANRAYETAGLSANEYMSTVTSFSASLLQSLGNDTKKAADYADRAIIDMSDNANKMGTSMESIQNAYQGFAKQNYTMLDNLKLGYGGTKTEMQRLIKDAAKMTDVQKDLGITVDASSMSFGNIVNAISVMQKSMGIAGTTAEEAMTTIEGSMNAAKAAWDNFLTGTISADEFADTFIVAVDNIVKNVGEIAPRLASTVPAVASKLYDKLISSLQECDKSSLVETGMQMLQSFVSGTAKMRTSLFSIGTELIQNVVTGLTENAPQITEKAGEIVSNLITGIQTNAPGMLSAAVDLFASFVTGIASQLPALVPQALQMIVTLADAVISNIPTIVSAGISLLKGLVQGIINGLPTLIAEGPRIINDFADAIYSGIGQLLKTGFQLIVSLVQGIWNNRGLLLDNAWEIFKAFLNVFSLSKLFSLGQSLVTNLKNGIRNLGPNIVSAGKELLKNLVSGIKSMATHPVATLSNIARQAMNAFKNIDWISLGKNIISGIVKGLMNSAGAIAEAAKNAAKKALDAAKDFLGIHSPSTVFRDQVGKYMAIGMGTGFAENIPVSDIENSLDKTIAKANRRIAKTTTTSPSMMESLIKNTTNNYTDTNFDYKKLKNAQKEAMNEANERPIILNDRVLNRAIRNWKRGPVLA